MGGLSSAALVSPFRLSFELSVEKISVKINISAGKIWAAFFFSYHGEDLVLCFLLRKISAEIFFLTEK